MSDSGRGRGRDVSDETILKVLEDAANTAADDPTHIPLLTARDVASDDRIPIQRRSVYQRLQALYKAGNVRKHELPGRSTQWYDRRLRFRIDSVPNGAARVVDADEDES
mgnify:FL=1